MIVSWADRCFRFIGINEVKEVHSIFNKQQHRQAAQSIFMSSVTGLANTGAVIVTFFTVPELYSRTVGWVVAFASYRYGEEFVGLTQFTWFVLLACLVFFSARASLSTLLVMGGIALAVRFL